MTWSPLTGLTVVSPSPWKTMVGTVPLDECRSGAALLHGGESGGDIAGGPAGQSRMDADGRIEIGICGAHDGRRGTARREAGDKNAARLDRDIGHDLPGDSRDERGLAAVALLIGGAEPVPAFRGIGRTRLLGIGDEEALLLGQFVHPRAGGKIFRRLRAAVQHHQKRQRLSA
jgi:hypothetical protein